MSGALAHAGKEIGSIERWILGPKE